MYSQAVVIMLFVGSPLAAVRVQPQLAPRGTMPSEHVAHIYYNIATGEKVATLLGEGARPADNGVSPEVWIADNTLPCSDFGQSVEISGVIDDPLNSFAFSTPPNQVFLDWGDIGPDTVVDCVGITWASQMQDADLDGDGVGDGIHGFAGSWAWYDAENGFDSSATRLPITGFVLTDLPGFVGPVDPNALATYTATIDLASEFSSSLVFEVGDTDSIDAAGTGLFNPGAGQDLDSDGFSDFGYSLQYFYPGQFDFDGDGAIDGDFSDAGLTAWTLVTGYGTVSNDGSDYVPETESPGANGIEDAFDMYWPDSTGGVRFEGTFFYGGFNCVGATGNTPFAQFYMKMYGAGSGGTCGVDIAPAGAADGVLNFFDLALYLAWFNAGDPRADLFPTGGDGSLNFFDLNLYIAAFTTGCP